MWKLGTMKMVVTPECFGCWFCLRPSTVSHFHLTHCKTPSARPATPLSHSGGVVHHQSSGHLLQVSPLCSRSGHPLPDPTDTWLQQPLTKSHQCNVTSPATDKHEEPVESTAPARGVRPLDQGQSDEGARLAHRQFVGPAAHHRSDPSSGFRHPAAHTTQPMIQI